MCVCVCGISVGLTVALGVFSRAWGSEVKPAQRCGLWPSLSLSLSLSVGAGKEKPSDPYIFVRCMGAHIFHSTRNPFNVQS